MKQLCFATILLIALPLNTSASETEWLSLGAGRPHASVVAKAGVGTEEAWLSGQVTENNATDFCAETQPDAIEVCSAELLAGMKGELYVITANCTGQTLTTADRITLFLNEQGQWHLPDGSEADDDLNSYSRHFDMLCAPAVAEAPPEPHPTPQDIYTPEPAKAVSVQPSEQIASSVEVALGTTSPIEDRAAVAAMDYASALAGIDHNGSLMWFEQARGVLYYDRPKPALAGIVEPGTVLFRGKAWNFDVGSVLEGTAYTFRKGCDPAPYAVSGQVEAGTSPNLPVRIVLRGPSPIRAKNGCAVLGYTLDSSNAVLVFDLHYGDV